MLCPAWAFLAPNIDIATKKAGIKPAHWLIPIRSAKLCGALKHEKHRGGLPCGWGREAPKEHWRIT